MIKTNTLPEGSSGPGSAGLLVSILLRFPEVGSVTFDPEERTLRFTVLVRRRLDAATFGVLSVEVAESVAAFGRLLGSEPRFCELDRTTFKGVTAFEFIRDVETFSREEMAMLIGLFRERFADGLVVESEGGLLEEDLIMQEQLIDAALDDLRDARGQQNLIAYREGGRVLVFNK